MKRITGLLLAFLILFAGCATEPKDEVIEDTVPTEVEETVETRETAFNVATLAGPTGIGFLNMMKESGDNFEILGTPDEAVAKIIKGEVDIASVPSNLAATLYNKTEGGISVVAINTLGVLYVVEVGETVNSIEDLQGKTLYSTGKGASPEYSLNNIIEKAGVLDVTVEFKTEHAELAALLGAGEADLAVLPEPFVTVAKSQNENLRVALDLNEEWSKVSEGNLITGVLVVRNEVIENNKEDLDAFLTEYKASIELANSDVEGTAKLSGEFAIIPEAQALTAIPKCNIVYIDGEEMQQDLSSYLEVLFNQDNASVGGKLPDESFYYKK